MSGLAIQTSIGELAAIALVLFGAFWFLIRLNAQQFTKAIETRFAVQDKARELERQEYAKLAEKMISLEREMLRSFVRKEEHTVAITVVNAKMDEINKGQRELLLKVGVLIGKAGGQE